MVQKKKKIDQTSRKVRTREAISKKYSEKIREGKETQFFDWLREKVKYYCQDPALNKTQQFERRRKLSSHLKIKESTLKGAYLYGQNKENIYKAALYIGVIAEKPLMQFLECYPAIVSELKSLPPWLREFYSNVKK